LHYCYKLHPYQKLKGWKIHWKVENPEILRDKR
jgi:hypothetical protein